MIAQTKAVTYLSFVKKEFLKSHENSHAYTFSRIVFLKSRIYLVFSVQAITQLFDNTIDRLIKSTCMQGCRKLGGRGYTPLQILAGQLTLSQPGNAHQLQGFSDLPIAGLSDTPGLSKYCFESIATL